MSDAPGPTAPPRERRMFKNRKPEGQRVEATGKRGRPQVIIDLQQLRALAAMQCTPAEAAAVLRVHAVTLRRKLHQKKYRDAWDEGIAHGTARARKAQFDLMVLYETLGDKATPADRAVSERAARWFGIQYMGQRSSVDVSSNVQHDHRHLVAGRVEVTIQAAAEEYAALINGNGVPGSGARAAALNGSARPVAPGLPGGLPVANAAAREDPEQ